MSGSVFQRIMNRILGREEASTIEDSAEHGSQPAEHDRTSIASDVDSKRWFAGAHAAPPPQYRDPVDSSPDTSRWFRRPKFVAPGDSLHHPNRKG